MSTSSFSDKFPKFPDVMLDLETLSTAPNAMILSIGAVKFNRNTKQISEDKFYRVIDINTYEKLDFDIDPATVLWWFKQSDEARKSFTENPRPIGDVLVEFNSWFDNSIYLWSHGASFDAVILGEVYKKYHLIPPWKFWNIRDTRTVYELGKTSITNKDRSEVGIAHNSLYDAIVQVNVLFRALKSLRNDDVK